MEYRYQRVLENKVNLDPFKTPQIFSGFLETLIPDSKGHAFYKCMHEQAIVQPGVDECLFSFSDHVIFLTRKDSLSAAISEYWMNYIPRRGDPHLPAGEMDNDIEKFYINTEILHNIIIKRREVDEAIEALFNRYFDSTRCILMDYSDLFNWSLSSEFNSFTRDVYGIASSDIKPTLKKRLQDLEGQIINYEEVANRFL